MNRFSLTSIRQLLFLLLQTLVLLTLTRVYFYCINHSFFDSNSLEDLLFAFIHGIRFDAAATALLLAPVILLILVFSWSVLFQRFLSKPLLWIAVVLSGLSIIVNTLDAEYFPYTGKRSGPEILSFWFDVRSQLDSLVQVYWFSILLSLSLVIIHGLIAKKIFSTNFRNDKPKLSSPKSIALYAFVATLSLVLTVFVARSSIGAKPIRPLHAYSWPSPQLGPLVSNTIFTLMKDTPGSLKQQVTFTSDEQALRTFLKPINNSGEGTQLKNVVIVLLESFGMEYFGPPYSQSSYTPFLNELSKQSLFYPYGLANGRRSIEAIPSVLSGMPSLLDEAFIRSPYQSNRLIGIGETLKNYGYQTAFFHGANNGSMYFDATTKRLGFDAYFGRDEYDNDADFDGQWGIFDEPFLQFTAHQLTMLRQPFAAGIFTISSHPPYTLPVKFKDTFNKGEIPMHGVVQYTDYALEQFFAEAKKQPWFKNTLFVITADHTSDNVDRDFSNVLSRHQVPIMFYGPGIKPAVRKQLAQQIDIPTTVVEYLNLPEQGALLPYGRSLLSQQENGRGFFQDEKAYWLLSGNRYVKKMKQKDIVEFGDLPNSLSRPDVQNMSDEELYRKLEAMVQVYCNTMLSNNLYSLYH